MFMKILVRIKNCSVLIIVLLSQNIAMDDLNTLVFGKMKDEMGGIAIEVFFGLKQKRNSILVSNSRKYKIKRCE